MWRPAALFLALACAALFDAQAAYGGDEGLHHYAETTLGMLHDHLRSIEAAVATIARAQTQDIQDPQSAEQPERAQ